jgi:uncharacterized RmlC-like cupin family protein
LKPDGALVAIYEVEARVVKPLQFDDHTPQTSGMHRLAAVSGLLTGAEKLWAGVMLAEPNTASSVHHHGPLETVVYVAEGRSTLRWGRRLEHESELEAGDFLFVPPFVPHQEINPSPDRHALWIVVRSGPEAVVVELTRGADGEYVAPDSAQVRPAAPDGSGGRPKALPLFGLAAVVGAVLGGHGLGLAGHGWQALLAAAILALAAVLGVVWQDRARTTRRLAALDAWAEREINRSRSDSTRTRSWSGDGPRPRRSAPSGPVRPEGGDSWAR